MQQRSVIPPVPDWLPQHPASAQLVLEEGTRLLGRAFGARGPVVGEVCFNTGMSGYQEVLTDPSYARQIVVMTAPQMGNTGITAFDDEARRPALAGFIVRGLSRPHNWRSMESLHAYLERHGIPGLFDVDTRALTRLLRDRGAQRGVLAPGAAAPAHLRQQAREWPGLEHRDLAAEVTCKQAYELLPEPETLAPDMRQGAYEQAPRQNLRAEALHIVVLDFGVKRNILHRLLGRGCRVTVVPAHTPAASILALRPQGVLLSNGPGDPSAVGPGIETVRALLGQVPLFGICLGHQILGLALGGRSYKLKFGHRGVNHPVLDHTTGKVRITTQNHGFALDAESLSRADVEMTEVSLHDGTLEGMRHRSLPVFSVQYHPEASPGPHDNDALFDRFLHLAAAEAGWELPEAEPLSRPVPKENAERPAADGADAAA